MIIMEKYGLPLCGEEKFQIYKNITLHIFTPITTFG